MYSQSRYTRPPTPRQPPYRPVVEALESRCLLDASTGYVQANLVSSIPGLAPHTDRDLINPWGFSETPQGQFRVSANGAGEAPLFTARGDVVGKSVDIPPPPGSPAGATSTPNGNLINTTADFVISAGGRSAPATVLFSTEDGAIAGWNPAVNKTTAILGADQSGAGAVYKLLALGSNAQGNFLYATNFHNGTIDVFDKNFHLVHLDGSFTDPTTGPLAIPQGFAPFGVKNLNGTLFVTYAKQDAAKHDDVEGVGNGFIDKFDTSGHFLGRFASQGTLNSPIGAAVAPADFGKFGNALLVGNFGDSRVNAFNPTSGAFLGQLSDAHGNPLTLNGGFKETNLKGLWGIGFGNGKGGAATNTLFFASGINAEADGLFGKVTVADADRGDHQHGRDAQVALAARQDEMAGLAGSNQPASMGAHHLQTGNVDRGQPGTSAAGTLLASGPTQGASHTSGLTSAAARAAIDRVFGSLELDDLGH